MSNLEYDFIIDRDTNKKCFVKYPNIQPWNSGIFIEFAKNKILWAYEEIKFTLNINVQFNTLNIIFYERDKEYKEINMGTAYESLILFELNKFSDFMKYHKNGNSVIYYKLDLLIIHELSHIFLNKIKLPLWFEEGFIQYLGILILEKYKGKNVLKRMRRNAKSIYFIMGNKLIEYIIHKFYIFRHMAIEFDETLEYIIPLLIIMNYSCRYGFGWMSYLIHLLCNNKKYIEERIELNALDCYLSKLTGHTLTEEINKYNYKRWIKINNL